jgi:hypothetical protein
MIISYLHEKPELSNWESGYYSDLSALKKFAPLLNTLMCEGNGSTEF